MKNFFCLVLGLVVAALIMIMPESIFISWEIQATAAVTILMIIWWITEAVPIPVTALVPLVGFPLFSVLTPAEACAPYADKTIFLFLGGFIIAASMQKWNLHRRIALSIILLTGTSPRQIILGFMIATAFLSLWISNTATAMMMIPIAVAIIGTIGVDAFKKESGEEGGLDFAKALVISIAYAASIGGLGTIIGSPPNGIFLAQLKTLFPDAPTIGFVDWMLFGIPLVAIFIPLTWLWLIYGPYRHLPSKLPQSRDIILQEKKKLGPITTGERWTLIVFVMTALMWIFSSTKKIGEITIPGLDILFPGIDDSTIAMFGAILLFLLPINIRTHEYTMDWENALKIPWGILLLFGGGICLSKAFIKSGLADELVKHLTALSILDVLFIVLLVAILVSFLTEVTSNTAIASVMMPILAVTSVSLMINPAILMLTAALTASLAFMLPVATPPNAVAYSTGYLTMRDLMRTGFSLNILGILLVTLFMYTIVLWALGISFDLPAWAVTP
ncbi:SLC13 family permease [Methanospirillum stamsii]|uniref:Anion transporter n=1 Tax=Methanospirillum stamsii TaxID=1277351 RepID=A0A2V2NHW8_9EURY|nr:SLC13 family permease [Methanospirillum stamsii]PWR76007.1 anion transporter [Methanospirillum stamsii]